MKDKLSLRTWALMTIIMPTLLLGTILGGYIYYHRHGELNQNLVDQGVFLSQPLTILSANAIVAHDQDMLANALNEAHRTASPIVKSISVFLPDHRLFQSSNVHKDFDSIKLPPGKLLSDNIDIEVSEKFIYVRSPIYGPETQTDSFMFINKNGKTLFGYLVVELSRDQELLAQQRSLVSLVLLLFFAFICTILVAIVFIDRIINPVRKLDKALGKISGGDSKIKVSEDMLGELNSLKQSVNRVSRSIHLAQEKAEHNISEHTQELQQTVDQLEEQNVALDMAKREALRANNVKSQFLANMSHELRTPLNGVLGFTRQLKKTTLNSNQWDFLDTIETSAKNLVRIINDILDFSKLDAGKMALESIPFGLRDTIDEVMTLMAPSIFEQGLNVYLSIDKKVPDELQGDPDRLSQIIINLIGNACKFTEEGHIRLEVSYLGKSAKGHQLQFAIKDTGVGIDEANKDKLFAAFGQADNSITRKYGGTGLGLIICKKLVDAMGGQIQFTSEVDNGSCFFFDVFIKENTVGVVHPLPLPALAGKRVLFFDNDPISFADTQLMLSQYDSLDSVCCDNQQAFTASLKNEAFDIVLLARHVSTSNINELKHLVQLTKPYCNNVFTIINSISPNMKENLVNTGVISCLSAPVNHRKLLQSMAAPFKETPQLTNEVMKFAGLKVLAVDDNEANLKLLVALLSEMSVQCDTAENGLLAVKMAQQNNYDLIYMDVQMPVMDGISACAEIKKSSLNEQTPIVSVTAHSGPDENKKMLKAGFDGYLAKPLDETMLIQTILDMCPHKQPGINKVEQITSVIDEQLIQKYQQVSGLDWNVALQRANGKPALAMEMFDMFVANLDATLSDIQTYSQNQKISELKSVVHKFHGACCYTGVPQLKDLADIIESGLKQHNDISMVEPEVFELIEHMENLQAQTRHWIN